MTEVNYWIIFDALSALEAEEAMQGDLGIDTDDTASVANAFASIVVPEVRRWSAPWREKLKLSLAYYLRQPDILVDAVLASLQDLRLAEPSDPACFFRLLWDSLFPGERPDGVRLDDIVENNDVMEINEITKEPL